MNLEKIGYRKYSECKPVGRVLAECIDEHGLNSWTAQIGPEGESGQIPYWWRPAVSNDELWRALVTCGGAARLFAIGGGVGGADGGGGKRGHYSTWGAGLMFGDGGAGAGKLPAGGGGSNIDQAILRKPNQ